MRFDRRGVTVCVLVGGCHSVGFGRRGVTVYFDRRGVTVWVLIGRV